MPALPWLLAAFPFTPGPSSAPWPGRPWRIWLLAAIALLALAGAPARASDLIVARAWLADPTGQLGIEDVVRQPFQPFRSVLARGYTHDAIWVRLDLRAPDRGTRLALRVLPSQTDDVRLYQAGPSGWVTRVTGDRHERRGRELAGLTLGFVIDAPAPQTTVYLRLRSDNLNVFEFEALDLVAAEERARQDERLHLPILVLALGALLWSTVEAWRGRDAVVTLYALQLGGFLLFCVCVMGYLAEFLPEVPVTTLDALTNVSICLWPFLANLFGFALLERHRPPTGWSVAQLALLAAFPIELGLLAGGYTVEALALSYATVLAMRGAQLGAAWSARHDPDGSLPSLRVVLVILTVLSSIPVPGDLGWVTPAELPWRRMASLYFFGLATTTLLLLLLRARQREQHRHNHQAVMDLALSQQALRLERSHREQAQQLARIDALTGLPNRRGFVEQGEHAVTEAVLARRPLAVLMIDLDHFKALNDALGHRTGDQVLQRAAILMQSALREHDLLGRLGGEEFGAVLVDADAATALDVARHLRERVSSLALDDASGERRHVSTSVGIALLHEHRSSLGNLLNDADHALYQAKAAGRNTERLYDPAVSADARQRARLTQALASALEVGELSVVYQPVFDARSGQPVCAEALLRWTHPQYGEISPDTFIDVAEDTGLIQRIGAWTLQQACTEAAGWPLALRLSVNLSTRQLLDPALVVEVHAALRRSGLDPQRLELEITESALAHEAESAHAIDALRALGIGLALDDFGTGFSSLSYVQRFRFDRLKIDRSFVAPLHNGHGRGAEALVRAVVNLARELDLECTAEGVETDGQMQTLRRLGCSALQGYHLARPMDAVTMRAWLAARSGSRLLPPAPGPGHSRAG